MNAADNPPRYPYLSSRMRISSAETISRHAWQDGHLQLAVFKAPHGYAGHNVFHF